MQTLNLSKLKNPLNANDTKLSCRNTINICCVYAIFNILPKGQNSNLIAQATVSKCEISGFLLRRKPESFFV